MGRVTQTTPAPVNLIVGKEGLLIDRARLAIVAAVRKAAATDSDPEGRQVPLDQLRAGNVTLVELTDLLSPSLFGEDRIVVLTECDEAGAEPAKLIVDAAKDPVPGITLILQHSGGGRQKKMVPELRKAGAALFEAEEVKARDLPNFVRAELDRNGVKASGQTVNTILDAVGSDLRELATAIAQLAADTGGKITPTAVRTYYGASAEVSGFEVAELALTGQAAEALAKMRRAVQLGVAPVLLASAVTRMTGEVARLHGVRSVNPNRDAATYGMPPWKLKKTHGLARAWSTPAMARAVQVAADLEFDVKGGTRNVGYALETAVLEIARLARESHRR
ncbi:DNA polymerase III subunit delta [Corynebacterium sp. 335C]